MSALENLELAIKLTDMLAYPALVLDQRTSIIHANEAFLVFIGRGPKYLRGAPPLEKIISFEQPLETKISEKLWESAFSTNHQKRGVARFKLSSFPETEFRLLQILETTLELTLHSKYQDQVAQRDETIKVLEATQGELKKQQAILENRVIERTQALAEKKLFLESILEGLDQGLLVFGEDLLCLPFYTKASIQIFRISPEGKRIDELLKLSEKEKEKFLKWTQIVFKKMIPFRDAKNLAIRSVEFDREEGDEKKERYSLEFFPIGKDPNAFKHLILLASDKTKEYLGEKKLKEKESYVHMVEFLLEDKDRFRMAIKNLDELNAQIHYLLCSKKGPFDFSELKRKTHAIKGISSLFFLKEVEECGHELENALEDKGGIEQIELALRKLDSSLIKLKKHLKRFLKNEEAHDGKLNLFLDYLKRYFEEDPKLESLVKKTFFSKKLRTLLKGHEASTMLLAKELQKELSPFHFTGLDLDLPENFLGRPEITAIFDALSHLFRNIVDHAIESPEDRSLAGKKLAGKIEIGIELEGSRDEKLVLSICDDGRGVSIEELEKIRLEKNLPSEENPFDIVFHESFSTIKTITRISGRGIGLSCVRALVQNAGGSINFFSKKGKGSIFRLSLPLQKELGL